MPARPDFWNIPPWAIALMYLSLGLAALAMVAQLWERMRLWRVGRPDLVTDQWLWRFARVVKYALLQVKVARRAYAGIMHLALFWALVVLLGGTALATVDTDFVEILTGDVYRVYEFVLDGFSLFLTLGLGMAMARRWLERPPQLSHTTRFSGGLVILFWIMATGLLVEGLRLAVQQPAWAAWSPVGNLIAQVLRAVHLPETTLRHWHLALWMTHWGLVALFFVILPQDTLYLHLVTAPLNLFFSDLERPRGALVPIENLEEAEVLGVGRLDEFPASTLLDADACTECGRCQQACPAFLAGRPLNPKQLILDIRAHLWSAGPPLLDGGQPPADDLIGGVFQQETLWACTTCYACVHECPVLIQHVDAIVGMRRHLTLLQGKPYGALQQALVQVERTGNPWGQPPGDRMAWASSLPPELSVPRMAERKAADILYWVGCAGSFDPNAQRTTVAMVKILHAANVDFAVLGEEEFCNCEFARRAGNEYLYQLVTERILDTLGKYTFNRILTQCPHCFNTLKNEYPQFGGVFQVVHHSQFIAELIGSGQLQLRHPVEGRLTFHDSCYLGRYNDVYAAPRLALYATGAELIEMARSREKGLCCGGGGANAWFELAPTQAVSAHKQPDVPLRHIQEIRLEEAMGHDVSAVATACPFCTLMLDSAAQSLGVTDQVAVRDIAELVAEAL